MIKPPQFIETIEPYVPGLSINDLRLKYNIPTNKITKLASNENPYGCSQNVKEAIRDAAHVLNFYPDPNCVDLRKKLANINKVNMDNILIGNGSHELIYLLTQTFTQVPDKLLMEEFGFIAYEVAGKCHGLEVIKQRVDKKFRVHFDHLLSTITADKNIKIVFLANPNNPTGVFYNKNELINFLAHFKELSKERNILLVLDYAYWEYTKIEDNIEFTYFLNNHDNVVILRTFSKVYGLAGQRVGYCIAVKEVINYLDRTRETFNINYIAQIAASSALDDQYFVDNCRLQNELVLGYLKKELESLGIEYINTPANFIMINVFKKWGLKGQAFFELCCHNGFIVRPLDNYKLPDFVRITIGTKKQMQNLIDLLSTI